MLSYGKENQWSNPIVKIVCGIRSTHNRVINLHVLYLVGHTFSVTVDMMNYTAQSCSSLSKAYILRRLVWCHFIFFPSSGYTFLAIPTLYRCITKWHECTIEKCMYRLQWRGCDWWEPIISGWLSNDKEKEYICIRVWVQETWGNTLNIVFSVMWNFMSL